MEPLLLVTNSFLANRWAEQIYKSTLGWVGWETQQGWSCAPSARRRSLPCGLTQCPTTGGAEKELRFSDAMPSLESATEFDHTRTRLLQNSSPDNPGDFTFALAYCDSALQKALTGSKTIWQQRFEGFARDSGQVLLDSPTMALRFLAVGFISLGHVMST